MNITIIGGGNMGSAIARGLLQKGKSKINITISDRSPEKVIEFKEQGVSITNNNIEAINLADIIIVAIKPQYVDDLFSELKDKIPSKALLISICAGVEVGRFVKGFNHSKIVRVMPNTPAKIGEAISGWYANPEVTESQKEQVKEILSAIGHELEVDSEDLIDAVTAVSGSGPAYIFYFLEKIIIGGTECGLTENQATQLALQTAFGATKLAQEGGDSIKDLREKVTSKGGTTEAAINYMKEKQVGENISEAVKAAYKRAKEL